MSKFTQEHILIQAIKNLTFVINTATQENIYDIKKQKDHPTTHYIWRTRGDGKVRSRHEKFNGNIFAWDKPPAGGYHPGEDWGCRCTAQPYNPPTNLREKSHQLLMLAASDASPAWGKEKFFKHYFLGKGKTVLLSEIGHLQKIIRHARTHNQGGGSIFDRVERDIYGKVRENGGISLSYDFNKSYSFHSVLLEHGNSVVSAEGTVTVIEEGEFFIIKANLDYTFTDYFRDVIDAFNIIEDIDEETGEENYVDFYDATPYKITDTWSTHIEGIIKKDSSQSEFPNL